jgi:O-acetyl-ADP-ribose deacetylase (regulator of RNase III)
VAPFLQNTKTEKIRYIRGDLFTTNKPVIAQGCNCQGVMGSGIARKIADKFPEVKTAYQYKYNKEGLDLGEIQLVPLWKPKTNIKIVANLMTQDGYGHGGIFVNYDACYRAFLTLFRYCNMHWLNVAIPKIGAGLGGGSWDEIERRLLRAIEIHPVELDIYYL